MPDFSMHQPTFISHAVCSLGWAFAIAILATPRAQAQSNPTVTQPTVPRLIEPEPRRHSGFNTPASIRPVPLPQNISPDLLTSFTRVIQPVLLNRCAAGACHGGRQSPFPQLDRSGIRTAPSRDATLRNIASLQSRGIRGTAPLLAAARSEHPNSDSPIPLSARQALVLEMWLSRALVLDDPSSTSTVSGVEQNSSPHAGLNNRAPHILPPHNDHFLNSVNHGVPVAPLPLDISIHPRTLPSGKSDSMPVPLQVRQPNRFRAMLEEANNPMPLWPPPQEPKGFLFPLDSFQDDIPKKKN